MTDSHPHLTRLRAKLKGEVSAAELEALRGAGSGIYDSFTAIEDERKQLAASETDLWHPEGADPRPRLAAWWRAFACQQLAEAFLDADYAADPGTAGYVPPVTAEQASVLFGEVEALLHDLNAGIEVRQQLTQLPHWVDVDPCPRAHLEAMVSACATMTRHAEIAVADLEKLGAGRHPGEYRQLQQDLAGVKADAAYVADLRAGLHGEVSQELHERIERTIKRAVEGAYRVGQLAAMPQLIGSVPVSVPRLPRPGEAGFDMWCLTDPDPARRRRWQEDPAAARAIEMLWQYDPDPEATLAIQAEINAALRTHPDGSPGDVRLTRSGSFHCCPFAGIYQAVNPVTIGGRRLRRGTQFTFDVSAEGMSEGGPFRREILTGEFHPTRKVDYCNPEEGDDDDD